MDKNESGAIDEKELRKRLLDQTFSAIVRFQSVIEESADKIYELIQVKGEDDKNLGSLRFKRWTHEDAIRFSRLPFYSKLAFGEEPLTEEEERLFKMFKTEMVYEAVVDKGKWSELLQKSDKLVEYVFNLLAQLSGISESFRNDLDNFLNGDDGKNYGLIWFTIFGKTPSEIAKLPETDVQVINNWFKKWGSLVVR